MSIPQEEPMHRRGGFDLVLGEFLLVRRQSFVALPFLVTFAVPDRFITVVTVGEGFTRQSIRYCYIRHDPNGKCLTDFIKSWHSSRLPLKGHGLTDREFLLGID